MIGEKHFCACRNTGIGARLRVEWYPHSHEGTFVKERYIYCRTEIKKKKLALCITWELFLM
ncbi:MAG: hypothetical protein A2676_05175 [Candidatus Sungbacteria bacterium RIFCSPHIGHO2_01_FULL_51_22]|uniref:Uncharacterized protein n=1 Tax=Candidatus Sungbacteria bacterium RIFCSPHIGHO2_02_FULL_51_29 TaxID=1802273 RepID=A0A1G2KSJ7_9BACT|nr:MAG: hypothetical protein A2676_05175 [Candidatus Sungbacteria bacterium RIFCSPHIGHO2_01_FULL_51_22]OHA01552.1 MAG: hypothetical protein A3C16_05270 [Candidatus Sungbacteria bacterium RIFCSPHIGHO2_02_FULL_51_29]OHA07021.1 MAG: hypothetical protein A3B29_01165 [Candidatus Sungbacteria bacterium RIFCSPLOWO2_01_FULL_51_34]